MTSSEQRDSRHAELMRLLAEEGAARCCYLPGAGRPEEWIKPTTRCDCKYRRTFFPHRPAREDTGCCEMRAAYQLLAAEGSRS